MVELGDTPLIGFAGAPFTLASYLVEGGPSRTHAKTKALMYGDPELWHALCGRLAEMTLAFLRVQIEAGVSAVQLFDSWAGALSEADYRRYVPPHSTAVLSGLAYAGRAADPLRGRHRRAARRDGRGRRGRGRRRLAYPAGRGHPPIGPDKAVQGNLDPCVLLAPWPVVEAEVRRILEQGGRPPGTCSTSATACCRKPTRRC